MKASTAPSETRLGVVAGVVRDEAARGGLGVRGDEQGLLGGEVAVRRRARDRSGLRGSLDGRSRAALGDEVAGGGDQRVPGPLLLPGPAGVLVRR